MGPHFGPQKMLDLPTLSEAVAKALEDLASVTSKTTDPELLLGFASLAPPGNDVRREVCQRAVKARSEYSPIAAVLMLMLDRVDQDSVDELIKRDPDNALGYYLAAHLLYASDRDAEGLEFFRRGAHCSELRLYEPITGPAIFKAIAELKLQGRDRLCALAWMACRSSNFNSRVLQFLSWPLSDWGRSGGLADCEEIAQLLIVLASQLFATNFYNRWAARQALDNAVFGLKAKVPGPEKFSTCIVNGSAAQGVIAAMLRWPGANMAEDCAEDFKPL